MTTLLLAYCIIHDFLIRQAIRNREDHIFCPCVLDCEYAINEDELDTAGRTTVYPKWYVSYVG